MARAGYGHASGGDTPPREVTIPGYSRLQEVRVCERITYTMALDEVIQCTEPPASLTPSCFLLPLSCFPLSLSLRLFPCTPVSKVYNRVLVLDEVVQFTEEDEWAYHEMAANVPLFSHPNPRSVSGVPAITLELLLLCHCTVVSSSLSSSSFFILLRSLIFSLSPSPSPHSPSGALTPLSFLSPPLPPYLLIPSIPSIPPHLTRCWW